MSPDARPAASTAALLGWLTLFGAAFGWVEAAVVVYLRRLYYPDGFAFPLVTLPNEVAVVEVVREAATILMLLTVACLASRTAWGRFGAFSVAFGVWDLVYYAGLYAALGWPESPGTWDVLFLIPGIWTGPVWSAAVIAVLLVVCGARMLDGDRRGERPRPRGLDWALSALSLLLILSAFLWNHEPALAQRPLGRFPWEIWLAGVLIGLVPFARLFLRAAPDAR